MKFFNVTVTPDAIQETVETLRSTWLSEGAKVERFESLLSDEFGFLNPVCLNSGTSALTLSLALSGIGPSDDVIIPSQTFCATGLACLQLGAEPIFADIDPHTGNITPESIESRITHFTRAVIPVHWGGYPCDLDEIHAVARQHGLVVIEDAAHALGATYKGKPIGSISQFTCFSFQAIKHLTTGDGGCLCCENEKEAREAKALRWFGIDRMGSRPSILGEREFDIKRVGYKFHMNDVAASIGLGNLTGLKDRLERRRRIGEKYQHELSPAQGAILLEKRSDREHAYWLFTMLVDRREDFIRAMQGRNIPVSVVHQGIHKYSVFGTWETPELPGQHIFDTKHICLPCHEGLSDEQVDSVVEAVKKGW
jgi:perosamine synthetase